MTLSLPSLRRLLCGVVLYACGGCAAYATPGAAADFKSMGIRPVSEDAAIEQSLNKKPLATLPTGIAVVRVQAPHYASKTAEGWGEGNYSVVTTRDVEMPAQIDRLAKLKRISGIAPINRLLLPEKLNTDRELRVAAAALHADILLVYTLDTTFNVEDKAAPLTVVTLGLSPNQQARLICTASAVLLDTRNGYVYGIAEATERHNQLTSAWTSETVIDEARRATESAAFDKLVGELEKTWGMVVQRLSSIDSAAVYETPG